MMACLPEPSPGCSMTHGHGSPPPPPLPARSSTGPPSTVASTSITSRMPPPPSPWGPGTSSSSTCAWVARTCPANCCCNGRPTTPPTGTTGLTGGATRSAAGAAALAWGRCRPPTPGSGWRSPRAMCTWSAGPLSVRPSRSTAALSIGIAPANAPSAPLRMGMATAFQMPWKTGTEMASMMPPREKPTGQPTTRQMDWAPAAL